MSGIVVTKKFSELSVTPEANVQANINNMYFPAIFDNAGSFSSSRVRISDLKAVINDSGATVILQGGNTLGEAVIIGSNDPNLVGFRTNSLRRMTITAAGRVLVKSETESTYDHDVNGVVRFGMHLGANVVRGNIDFDNSSNAAYITQNGGLARSIKIPGTGGNAPWLIYNNGSNGLQVVDSTTPNNYMDFKPGNNNGIGIKINAISTPNVALGVAATSDSDINLLLGNAQNLYANRVGYNVKIQAGAGGAAGNLQGGHVYITPGAGGGSGASGNVIVGGLRTFAHNATAVAAGLAVGSLYIRTGHGLDIVV